MMMLVGGHPELSLPVIEPVVITAAISTAELIAVGAEGAKRRVIARSIAKPSVALGMISPSIVGIARAVFGPGAKSLPLRTLYQRRNSTIRWR